MPNSLIVSLSNSTGIIIGATGRTEIAQNVRTIISTIKGSVFLDRAFGIDGDIIDSPQNRAAVLFRNEVMDQIELYEPRVRVVSVDYERLETEAGNGKLSPVVKIQIKEGVLL